MNELFNYRYQLIETLGEGAQGEVKLAVDTVTDRQVAVKLLHFGQSDSWTKLFKHEFEILADLSHPYLAQVHDFGVAVDGKVYFTRDYIPGEDLMSATQGLGAEQFVAVCVQMCRALRPLHRSGLLHGDIKPGNLVFGPMKKTENGAWTCAAFPIDFSFVRPAAGQSPPRGTLQYIAPEILEQRPTDVRADLYALGVSIFQAASGECPFDADIPQILSAHHNGEIPRLICRRITVETEEETHIVAGLIPIVARLLATHPGDRFPDIDELEAALTSLCPGVLTFDNESAIPSRNVLANKDGLSKKILENVQQRMTQATDISLNVVEGEVGSGRSALRKAVKWQAQLAGMNIVEISFSGQVNLFSVVSELLAQVAIFLGGTAHEGECKQLAAKLSDFTNTDYDIHQVSNMVARLVRQAASIKPLLLTVEYADRACTEALTILRNILAESSRTIPFAMLVTTDGVYEWRNTLGAGRAFSLSMLNENDIADLIMRYLSIDGAPIAGKILEHTAGNPLFVTQLLCDCVKTSKNPESIIEQTSVSDVQSYWQQKLTELTSDHKAILKACAILYRPCDREMIVRVADVANNLDESFEKLCRERWLKRGSDCYAIRSTALANQVMSSFTNGERRLYSERAFNVETVVDRKLIHATAFGEINFIDEHATKTISTLEVQGALSLAKQLAKSVVACGFNVSVKDEVALILGRLEIALGELETAKGILVTLQDHPSKEMQQSALRYLGKIAVKQSSLDDAAALLERALHINEIGETASSIFNELCEIEFRRGRYEKAIEISNKGIDLLEPGSPKLPDLLCSKAKGYVAIGKHDVALTFANEAVELAVKTDQKQLLAFAIDVRSWVLSLQGDLAQATFELEKSAGLYRELGDIARLARSLQVIGNNYWWMENWSMMLKKHEEAMRVAASLDNPAVRNEQLIAYGYALNCIGRFEQASLVLGQAKEEAHRLGDEFQQAKVAVYQGHWNAWQGNLDAALSDWQLGYTGFEKLSNYALLAELSLEIAGAYICKDTDADFDIAKNWIKKANSYHREDLGRHFEALLLMTEGQLLLARGDFEKGCAQLNQLIATQYRQPINQLKWQAHLFIAEALIQRGMSVLARKNLREAEIILMELAKGLPPEHQKSFWQDARRAKVKSLQDAASSEPSFDSQLLEPFGAIDIEATKLYKVLEFNKRLSRETDMDGLTAEILDAAIELTGAERGFFLSKVDADLEIRAAREIGPDKDSPHLQFSCSIAESVYLDNEPVLTVDAATDPRFNEFLSIHHLQIRSVACLPISYRGGVLGVLYLENRLAKGKFNQKDMRMLGAFSDQMAIALAHAKALKETMQVRKNLEDTAERLKELVDKQSEDLKTKEVGLELAREQLARIKMRVANTGNYHGLIGSGQQMQRVFNILERIKDNDIPIVIEGESGTGKDAVAKVLHEIGNRQAGPFVTLTCGAVPENLVESTLFGHRQGAFSGAQNDAFGIFESAIGGTLYLDDIAEMSRRMQVDLLRVLQEGAFTPLGDHRKIRADFRLICSSKVPLAQLVSQGTLRADLFYRLQVVTVALPPLRDRKEDIAVLATQIAKREAVNLGLPYSGFGAGLLDEYAAAQWPGNIRELEQSIRRALVIGGGVGVLTGDLEMGMGTPETIATTASTSTIESKEIEKNQILRALENTQWNKSKAAKALGMPRRTFYRRLKYFDIV